MIEITLQLNKSEEIVVDKDLENVAVTNANLKEPTNIINPSFIFRGNFPNYNYLTCNSLNRSYYIRDIVSLSGGMWEIVCECDVLYSFRNEIRNNSAIIRRQETKNNLLYNDGTFRTYQNPHIVCKTFPLGFDTNASSFVLAVAGGAENIEE